MATYYVRKTGNNGNAGTSPGAAYLTVAQALTAMGTGDTAYIGAGVYRENLTLSQNSLSLLGDPQGAVTGDGGETVLTNYLTNDTTAPSGVPLNLNGKTGFLGQYLTLVSGTGNCVTATNAAARNITFRDCRFHQIDSASASAIALTCTVDVASTLLMDRCWFFGAAQGSPAVSITAPTSAAADYDVGVVVNNCFCLWLGIFVRLNTTGALSFKPGGIVVKNCTAIQTNALLATNTANCSTTIPCLAYNSISWGNTAGLNANSAGQIVEDYNRILATTARVNVTAGAHSVADNSHASLHALGLPSVLGSYVHPLGMPSAGSPIWTFGNNATYADSVDIFNLTRVYTSAIGCFDYRDQLPVHGGSVLRRRVGRRC